MTIFVSGRISKTRNEPNDPKPAKTKTIKKQPIKQKQRKAKQPETIQNFEIVEI